MFPTIKTLLLLALCHRTATASTVVAYADTECKTIAANLTAPNGYPDGECTDVSRQTTQSFQSFQFLSLDVDCAPTVYQASDEDDCSGEAIVASLGTCYNTSWVDYSVDGCTAVGSSGNATVTSSSAAPSVVLPTTTATTATAASSSTGSAPSATASEGSGASVRGLARAGSAGVGAALVSGMYFALL